MEIALFYLSIYVLAVSLSLTIRTFIDLTKAKD